MIESTIANIFDFFAVGGNFFALFIISMIPLIELRGSIILGAALQMNWFEVFTVSVIGNILPVPLIIFFGERLLNWLKTTKLFAGITRRYEARLMGKADKVMKYSAIGLCLFVAVPLPGTGAWSGAALAALLNMPMRYALPAITLGVIIAGIIMTVGSYGFFNILSLF